MARDGRHTKNETIMTTTNTRTIYITTLEDNTFRVFDTMTMAILYGISTDRPYKVLVTTDKPLGPIGCLLDDPGSTGGDRAGALWASRGVDFSSKGE